jgi:hypothetical protein
MIGGRLRWLVLQAAAAVGGLWAGVWLFGVITR